MTGHGRGWLALPSHTGVSMYAIKICKLMQSINGLAPMDATRADFCVHLLLIIKKSVAAVQRNSSSGCFGAKKKKALRNGAHLM